MVAQSRLSRVDLPDERLWVKWYLTKRCDLGCAFCHNAMSRKHWPKETAEGLVDIAQAMVDSGEVKGVTLLGGEPTLADGLFEVCRIFDRADLPFGLITAGHHVASPRFEEIFGNSQLSFVGISLDGFDAGVVEAIRGRDIFAAQQNGLRALLDFRERGSSNYKVHVNLIVHRLSRDSVLDSLDRLAAFGVDRVQLLAYNNTDLGERNAPDLRLTFTEELELVEQLVEHMRVRVGSQWPPAFQIEPSFVPAIGRQYMREILHADVAAEGHVCPIAQKTIFVSGSGDVYACEMLKPYFGISPAQRIGALHRPIKISESGLNSIWSQSDYLLETRQQVLDRATYRNFLPCKECSHLLVRCVPCAVKAACNEATILHDRCLGYHNLISIFGESLDT